MGLGPSIPWAQEPSGTIPAPQEPYPEDDGSHPAVFPVAQPEGYLLDRGGQHHCPKATEGWAELGVVQGAGGFLLDIREKFFLVRALAQAPKEAVGIPGTAEGQVGQDSEQPGLVEGCLCPEQDGGRDEL